MLLFFTCFVSHLAYGHLSVPKVLMLPASTLTFNKNYKEPKIQESDPLSFFQFTSLGTFETVIDVLTSTSLKLG